MLTVGSYDEFTLFARFDVVFLHESSNPFFPNSHTISSKFSPAMFAFAGCMHSLDVNQQSGVADALAGNRWIIRNSSPLMSKITARTDIALRIVA